MLFFLLVGCAGNENKRGALLARDQEDYKRLGITQEPAPREDGLRTSGKEGSFEWWYFDAEHTDGTKIVAVFYTKHKLDRKGPAQPTLTLEMSLPDGKKINKEISDEKGTLIRASADKCDVQIRDSFARYNKDGNYEIHVKIDDINFDCVMKPKVQMWRPGTGYTYFGEGKDKYLGWFVGVPGAEVESKLTVGNEVKTLKGTGYHDHNWGNEDMVKLISHWYWARVVFDDYTVILDDFIANNKYGYTRIPVFLLAKDGKVIDDSEQTVKIIRTDTIQHPITKKFMDNSLSFIQKTSDGTTYQIDLKRKEDILFLDILKMSGLSDFMIKLAKLIGENPTYVRIAGDATLTITDKNGNETKKKTTAIWEQMCLSKEKDAIVHDYRPGAANLK
jgi:hypothetical protein